MWRLLCVSMFLSHCIVGLKLSSVTSHVRLSRVRGTVSGFVDFNADKTTDIIVQTGNNVSVYLWSSRREHFRLYNLTTLQYNNDSSSSDDGVRSSHTRAVDLDGDGQVDILSLTEHTMMEDEGGGCVCYTMAVYWMKPQREWPIVDDYQIIAEQVLFPPLILDSNGDHIPDILTHSCHEPTATLWTSRGLLHEFESHMVTSSIDYHSAYYVDITNDDLADVIVDGMNDGVRSLVLWHKNPSCNNEVTSLLLPSLPVPLPLPLISAAVLSPLAFTDIDGDGIIDAVAMSCPDTQCTSLHVHILSHEYIKNSSISSCKFSPTHPVNFTHVHTVSITSTDLHISPSIISIHPPVLGDINLDGYSDIIVPASSNSGVLLLVARQCHHDHCNGSQVTLDPQWVPVATGNITSVAFFDLWEDGVLDILLTQHNDDDESSEQLVAIRHSLQDDHAFLKVLVLSGYCYHDCQSGQVPYGSVLPGVVVRFSTTDRMGRQKESVRTVMSGHAHQLPFIVFGLGQTPSLVERLKVVVEGGGSKLSHTWKNLVPNSQLIIIPYPPNEPDEWSPELYLTPGRLVYTTAGVLAGLFIATAILVLLLQAREKFQDTREKRMAKHKFHFNAM